MGLLLVFWDDLFAFAFAFAARRFALTVTRRFALALPLTRRLTIARRFTLALTRRFIRRSTRPIIPHARVLERRIGGGLRQGVEVLDQRHDGVE